MTPPSSPLLSIIIPVYNGEKYLRPTLESIMTQPGVGRCEIIAVNDGSTDRSSKILSDFKSRYPNIRVIDKANEGVSIARNRGMEEARGRYILFMDADDMLHSRALSIIFPILEADSPDILVWGYSTFYNRPKEAPLPSVAPMSLKAQEAFNTLMDRGCGVGLWLKAFRRELIQELSFIPGMTFGEDMFFGWKAILLAKSILFIDLPLYLYRQTASNATSRYHKALYESYANAFADLRAFIDSKRLMTPALDADLDYHFARRIPALTAMEIKAPYSREEQEKSLRRVIEDQHISSALASDSRLRGRIYLLARDGNIPAMLSDARSAARKEKLLYPLKRLLK